MLEDNHPMCMDLPLHLLLLLFVCQLLLLQKRGLERFSGKVLAFSLQSLPGCGQLLALTCRLPTSGLDGCF